VLSVKYVSVAPTPSVFGIVVLGEGVPVGINVVVVIVPVVIVGIVSIGIVSVVIVAVSVGIGKMSIGLVIVGKIVIIVIVTVDCFLQHFIDSQALTLFNIVNTKIKHFTNILFFAT
jgi:hypothetical protein